jgi:predicted permease
MARPTNGHHTHRTGQERRKVGPLQASSVGTRLDILRATVFESLLTDVRLAARTLRRNPSFTAAAVLTLAIGIGATTAVFSVVYGVVYRPLPFPHADRLVQIVQVTEPTATSPEPIRMGLTPDQFLDLQHNSKTLEAVGTYAHAPRTLTGIDPPMRLSGAGVSPGLFAGLGVDPILGRMFVPADGERPVLTDPVVILSHRTWVRYFKANPGIVDRRIALGETRPLVIGVMPEGFGFPSLAGPSMAKNSAGELEEAPEFWFALSPFQRTEPAPGFSAFTAFAILRENVSPVEALTEIRSLLPPLPRGYRATIELVAARREMAARVAVVLTTFQLGVTLILLIACVNVANLLLSRAAHRRHENAIRAALGASRTQIVRENVSESILLAIAGGGLGCLFAYGLVVAVRALPPHLLPRLRDISVDGVVLLFALGLSVGVGLLVGLFSGLRAGRLHASSLTSYALLGMRSTPHRRLRPSSILVVAEIAATMVLVTGAGLLINSFTRLMRVDPGFRVEDGMTFRIALPNGRYPSPDAQQTFVHRLLERVRAIPGIKSAAATGSSVEGGGIGFFPLVVDGRAAEAEIRLRHITPDYFRTLGAPILQGREFDDADRTATAVRAIVNEAFVARHLGDRRAVGTVFGYGNRPSLEIIGVVANLRVALDDETHPAIYLPGDSRAPFVQPSIVIRSSTAMPLLLPSIREAVRRADPELAVYNAMTLEEMLGHPTAPSRLYTVIAAWCALIALVLAAIGLYGVLAYSVSTRTQEFGIRMALGADSGRVLASVMRAGLALSTAGVAAGLLGSFYLSRFLETLLFDLTPRDGLTYALAVATFFLVTIVACYIPSRRAMRIDPVLALRAE